MFEEPHNLHYSPVLLLPRSWILHTTHVDVKEAKLGRKTSQNSIAWEIRCKWEDNKIVIIALKYESVDWIEMAQDIFNSSVYTISCSTKRGDFLAK